MLDDLNDAKIISDLNKVERRDVLKLGLAGLVGGLMPLFPSRNAYAISNFASWKIAFRNAHTGESFSGVYRVGDKYLPEAFERMNYVLRDFRTNEVFPMDPRVIDIVKVLQERTKSDGQIEVLSGYRSPKTNSMLRNASSGVARNSFHMYGQAMDIRMPGYSTARLRDAAKRLKSGGVGYYSKSNFVHVDTGKVRSW